MELQKCCVSSALIAKYCWADKRWPVLVPYFITVTGLMYLFLCCLCVYITSLKGLHSCLGEYS